MEGIWTRFGQVVARRTVVVLIIVAVVTAVLAGGLSRLDFATGQDSYIDKDSTEAQDNRRYQDLFGGESMVVLFTVPDGDTVVDLDHDGCTVSVLDGPEDGVPIELDGVVQQVKPGTSCRIKSVDVPI